MQGILTQRGRPRKKAKNEPKAFCGLFVCGECGKMITAEVQKGHTYYRCTKKGKTDERKEDALEQKQNDWLEPFKEWINTAHSAPKIARDEALFPKKALAKEIFGSNLLLAEKKA